MRFLDFGGETFMIFGQELICATLTLQMLTLGTKFEAESFFLHTGSLGILESQRFNLFYRT